MMLPMLLCCVSIAGAETAAATQEKAEALQAEIPPAPGEAAPAAPGADADQPAADEKGKLKPGTKKETKDWADDSRWGRYQGEDGEDADDGDEGREPGAAVNKGARPDLRWPPVLRRRSGAGAFLLGALVGFGSGYYYAGEARRGLLFSVVDGVLVMGAVCTTVILNQLVINEDFKTGLSLARGEREMRRRESQLYAASVVFALGELGSRVFQGVGSMQAARRTNRVLDGVTFVPLGAGAAMRYEF